MKTIFLYHPQNDDLFAYFPFKSEGNGYFMSYSQIGQHSICSPKYALECIEATDEQIIPLKAELVSLGYDLETSETEFHRNPTQREIRFGEGATHYKNFDCLQYLRKDGSVKSWLKCPVDGLRYYY